ncbi:hypothetical protein GOBAR_AA24859 [Gossypium barbadense]|uniref:ABC transporter domain-containing protein n=1 Tax=Gossypium barbadense TaxID=3634 RepID=A0A2P5WXQ7_GOSBA|nr:hypothetical protein GOBAR_AA24859 [Gossypium barbadense]
MDSLQSLPPLLTLSTSVSSALNAKLGTNHDLTQAPSITEKDWERSCRRWPRRWPEWKRSEHMQREKVEQLLLESTTSYPIICDNPKKIYPARDGNPAKIALRGLSLALPRGECFGMLGPNDDWAHKTNLRDNISSGFGYTDFYGYNLYKHGCLSAPDLLWETLTGREHLLFYGRLKNLKASALNQAVEDSLKSVNLFHGGVADKHAGKYSGGMKRRLSVAISLIGDPKVVFMDETSTGLDPASRKSMECCETGKTRQGNYSHHEVRLQQEEIMVAKHPQVRSSIKIDVKVT